MNKKCTYLLNSGGEETGYGKIPANVMDWYFKAQMVFTGGAFTYLVKMGKEYGLLFSYEINEIVAAMALIYDLPADLGPAIDAKIQEAEAALDLSSASVYKESFFAAPNESGIEAWDHTEINVFCPMGMDAGEIKTIAAWFGFNAYLLHRASEPEIFMVYRVEDPRFPLGFYTAQVLAETAVNALNRTDPRAAGAKEPLYAFASYPINRAIE